MGKVVEFPTHRLTKTYTTVFKDKGFTVHWNFGKLFTFSLEGYTLPQNYQLFAQPQSIKAANDIGKRLYNMYAKPALAGNDVAAAEEVRGS